MSYRGPSLIGLNSVFNQIAPFLVTDGYVQIYGADRPSKVFILYSSGLFAMNIDTQNALFDVGMTMRPTVTSTYDLGEPTRRYRAVYADSIDLGFNPNEVVITDGNGLLISSDTLPTSTIAYSMELYNPLLAGATTQALVQINSGSVMFSSNTIAWAITINGVNNANKFLVQNLIGTTVFNIDTTTSTVTTRNNTLDNGSGNMSVVGSLAVSGSNNATKLQVVDVSLNSIFLVNTTTSAVYGRYNTLDNGGNMTAYGQMAVVSSDNANKFRVLDNLGSTIFNVNTLTDTVTTINNTLDNGSGDMTIVGKLHVTGSNVIRKFYVLDASNVEIFHVDSLNGSTNTKNNILDDGAGNATFTSIGAGSCTFSALYVTGINMTNKFGVLNATSVVIFNVNTTASSVTTRFNTLDDGAGAATLTSLTTGTTTVSGADSTTKFRVLNNAAAARFTVNTTTGAVTTVSNTLDNGSGTATFGAINAGTTGITGNTTISGTDSATKFRVLNSSSASRFTVNTSTGVVTTAANTLDNGSGAASLSTLSVGTTGITGVTTISGTNNANKFRVQNSTPTTIFNVNTSTSAVTTISNTLDNGSGAMTIVSLSTGGLTSTGNTTVSGADSTTKFRVLNNAAAARFTVNTTTGAVTTVSNTLDNGSGAMTTVSLSTGAGTFSGNTLVNGVDSATKFRVQNSVAGDDLIVNTLTGSLTSRNNILDNGSGAMTITSLSCGTAALAGTSTTTLTASGRVTISSTNDASKFQVLDNSAAVQFNVNTSTSAVTTKNNTLDNGTGSTTVVGNLLVSSTNATGKFTVQNASAIGIFNVNTTSGAVATRYCTIDDGAGLMTVGTNSSTNANIYTTSSTYNTFEVRTPASFNGAAATWNTLGFMTGTTRPGYIFNSRESTSTLNIMPGYKGTTATAGWITYDLPGVGNHYFWDNVEISGTLTGGSTLSIAGTSTMAAINCYQIQPRADNAYSCGANGARWSTVWAANGTIQTSDENDKEDIEDLIKHKALEMVKSLRPVKYRWKHNQEKHIGLLAQQVKATLDSLELPNNGIVYEPVGDESHGLNYASLIPVILSCMQQIIQVLEL